MRMQNIFTSAIVSLIGLAAISTGAHAGFCSSYEQTSSNAGHCPTCQLNVKSWPREQAYTVFASNGWQAELNYAGGDSSVAFGGGTWRQGLGHAYAGKSFDIDLSQQGRTLSMIMSTMMNGQRQVIRATFRCTG
ncbi:MAG: hypothetical protein AAFV45_00495 [Pseudomonadota bacterium]